MIYHIENKLFPSNTYVLAKEKDCIVIDPGLDTGNIIQELKDNNLRPLAVMSTHGHFDHIAGVDEIVKEYNVPFYLHHRDVKLSRSANFYLKLAKINRKIDIVTPQFTFQDEFEFIKIKDFNIKVFNFPGHSEGSCIFQYENSLFSGDILYRNGLGFNNFPGEDKVKLRASILRIFKTFDFNCKIYPGHGLPATLREIELNNNSLKLFLED
jgi:hydroxyacylglutathione hydrolase